MNIGTILFDTYARWGEKKWEKLREHGFSCADYGMMGTESGAYPLSEAELETFAKRERQQAQAAGVFVSQVHGPWRYPPMDATPEQRQERMEKMKRSIHTAALLGAPNWVIHPLMPWGVTDRLTGRVQETLDINLEFFSRLAEVGREYGVTVCLENMPFREFSLSSPEEILTFVQTVNHPSLKVCLDTGHAAIFLGANVGQAVHLLGDELRALHIHDNDGQGDYHWQPYAGIIDWPGVGTALQEIGFDGCFSLETHPSLKLPTPLFEEACVLYRKIAESILHDRQE